MAQQKSEAKYFQIFPAVSREGGVAAEGQIILVWSNHFCLGANIFATEQMFCNCLARDPKHLLRGKNILLGPK